MRGKSCLILVCLVLAYPAMAETCVNDILDLSLSCDGEVTEDAWIDGCRFVTCEDTEGSVRVRICEFPGGAGDPNIYYEVWRDSSDPNEPLLCVGEACVNTSSMFFSGDYPACDFSAGNIAINEGTGYPLEHNELLTCDVTSFSPTLYDWVLSDGTILSGVPNTITHTFPGSGLYRASCTATGSTAYTERPIMIDTPVPEVTDPFVIWMSIGEIDIDEFRFACDFYGWRPDTIEWDIDGFPAGSGDEIVETLDPGEHIVMCTGNIEPGNEFELNETHYSSETPYSCTECLTRSVVRTVLVGSEEGVPSLLTGLISYFPEDSSAHLDLVGGHNGVETGSVDIVPGKIEESSSFPGGVANVASVINELNTARTIALWVKFGEPGVILQLKPNYDLYYTAEEKLSLRVRAPRIKEKFITPPQTMPIGEWHHVVLVIETGEPRVYVDGELRGALEFPAGGVETTFRWGARHDGDGFTGLIDEIGLWDRVLSPEEISKLYNRHAGRTYPFGTGIPVPSICHDQMKEIPSSCSGTILSDAIDGSSCRIITCEDSESTTVKVCNKPGLHDLQFYEVIRTSGPSIEVCVGETCVNRFSGYAKGDLPYCIF